MKQLLLLTGLIFCTLFYVSAQKVIVTGGVFDSSHNIRLEGATVALINSADSSLITFVRSDSAGNFAFPHVESGKYRVSASYPGYTSGWKTFTTERNPTLNLGRINLHDKSILSTVIIESEKPPVSVNGDTLEFNAGSFSTKPNAVVEDLLKKMPGIQVDKNGTVRVNGQVINKIYVNGKEFFTGDPKLATKNLPADAIDKVQVFEKRSEQSEFTGFNDGNSQTAINLRLKKDKKNPTFGKATAGGGSSDRYDNKFNLNRFKGDQQLSAIGMANNTNKQGFSLMDVLNFTGEASKMMKGGGGRIVINNGSEPDFGVPVEGGGSSNSGIAKTLAGGINYNDSWNNKTDINGSYFYNNVAVNTIQNSVRQNLLPSSYNYIQNTNSNKSTKSSRFNLSYDHKIDSFNSIKITPSVTVQQNRSGGANVYRSLFADGTRLNSGQSENSSAASGNDLKNNILYRHKYAKKGRSISSNISMSYNESMSDGSQFSRTNFFIGGNTQIDTLNQQNNIRSTTRGYTGNIVYTEPISKKTLLEANVFYGFSKGDLTRNTFDFNNSNGKYDNLNGAQSNAYNDDYQNEGSGLSIRHVEKKYTLSLGANLQFASLNSRLKDTAARLVRHFTNVLPSINFTFNFSRLKTLKLDFNSSTTPPTTLQLQPVPDSSDRLNIVLGNPLLKQQVTHNASLQFFNANPALQKNLMMFGNFSYTQDAIVNSDIINNQGTRSTQPVNSIGIYNAFATVNGGFRIKKINTHINLGGNILYSHYANCIEGNKNIIGNTSYSPRLSANYNYKDKFDITAEARVSINNVSYSYTKGLNNHYSQQQYSVDANAILPWDININSDVAYTINSGRSVGFNKNICFWNAAISKLMFKSKKGELKFSVNDILNQNVGISRNANQNYVEDVTYQSLERYFLVSFTYSLMKVSSGGPKVMLRRF